MLLLFFLGLCPRPTDMCKWRSWDPRVVLVYSKAVACRRVMMVGLQTCKYCLRAAKESGIVLSYIATY